MMNAVAALLQRSNIQYWIKRSLLSPYPALAVAADRFGSDHPVQQTDCGQIKKSNRRMLQADFNRTVHPSSPSLEADLRGRKTPWLRRNRPLFVQ